MNAQVSMFQNNFQFIQPAPVEPDTKNLTEDGEGVSWNYSKTRFIDHGNGVVEMIPAKLKKDGSAKKYPLNSKKGIDKKSMPIKKEEDVKAILSYLIDHKAPMYSVAFQLGINLGLRANELLARKWEDVLDKDGNFRIIWDVEDLSDSLDVDQSKTSKQRSVYLNEACVEVLQRYRRICKVTTGYLFPSREGKNQHITVGMLGKNIKEAAVACGITYNVGTHSMRQTWGYREYKRRGRTEYALTCLQHFFGHTDPMTTMRYIGIFGEEEKRAFREGSYNVFAKVLADRNGELPEEWM